MSDLSARLRAVCDLELAEAREYSGRHEYDGIVQDLSPDGVRGGLAALAEAAGSGAVLEDAHDEAHLAACEDRARVAFGELELHRRNPLMAILMTVFMLSLAGFPPFVGFFGKLFLFTAGVNAGYTWLVVLAVLMSVVSVYYYVRVLIPVWSTSTRTDPLRPSVSSTMAIVVSGAFSLVLGLYPTSLLLAAQLGAVPFGP